MTAEILTLKSLEEAINKSRIIETIKQEQLVAEAVYEAVVPAMIGDFTGETIKLLEDPETRSIAGALLTGVPTAQQIIGRARWLMRVAIATVTGAKTHREAEQNPKIKVRVGRKILLLGPVELVFGTTRPGVQWKGLLSVVVEPVYPGRYYEEFSCGGERCLEICNAFARTRQKLFNNIFYVRGLVWTPKPSGSGLQYRLAKSTLSRNRFNSLLAMGSYVCPDGQSFIPKSLEGHLKLIGPARQDLLRFTVRIYLDTARVRLTEDTDKTLVLVRLGVLSLLAVPVLLGLGKGVNRGFGRFIPRDEINVHGMLGECPECRSSILANPRKLIRSLCILAGRVVGGGCPDNMNINEKLVPVLPVGLLEQRFTASILRKDPHGPKSVEEALGLIGSAALKMTWKWFCGSLQARGIQYHTWPLGLPRKGKAHGVETGYFLDEGEGRRQSFLTAYTLDGETIHVIGFPSDDLRTRILKRLKHKSNTSVKQVASHMQNAKMITNWRRCRPVSFSNADEDPEIFTRFLETVFNNYKTIVQKLRVIR